MKREDQGGRRKGASGMEYGVVVGLIAVVAVAATATVGGKVKEIFGGTTNAVQLGMNGQLAPGANLSLSGGVVAPVAPTINTGSLPGGTTGIAYSQPISVTAQNGDGVAFSSTGALPTGLSLNASTGVVSGTPSAPGTFAFSIVATDTANTLSSSQAYSVVVAAGAPAIQTGSSLPNATYASAWSQTLAATTTPSASGVTWSLTGGSLPAWMSFNGTTGVLSGTPNSMAAGSFTLAATDKVNGQSSSLAYTLSVVGTAPAISTSSLPASVWGTSYSQTLAGTTTPAPDGINWSFASGTLPTGLSLNGTTGAITGTPTAQGSFPLTILATDKITSATASRTITLTGTSSGPAISTASLPAGYTTAAYSQTLAASTTPALDGVTWAFASGTLPSGLSLNAATGVISGTSVTAGSYPLTLQATDVATGAVSTLALAAGLSIVAGVAPNITTTSLPASVWGTAYSQTLAAVTTPAPSGVNWTMPSGTLPSGLSFTAAAGTITGTPAAVGSFPLVFVATDKVSSATATRSITLSGTATAPVVTTTSVPGGYASVAYSQTLAATTAPAPDGVNWTIASGTLPSGLGLSTAGVISGTTASAGTYPLSVLATDKVTGATATQSLAGGVVISAAQVINVTISSSTNNVDFRSKLTAAGWNGTLPVVGTVTIAGGVWIGSASTASPALTISGSFPAGSSITLVNNGHISGAGGYQNSAVGGPAIQASAPVSIQNNGYIWGGGGAGGHAGSYVSRYSCSSDCWIAGNSSPVWAAGGAGGGGGGTIAGWRATSTAGGAGSGGCVGGTGGAPGYAGAAGGNCGAGGNSPGGAVGNYIVGNSYVTWTTAGTRLGGAS